MRKHSSLLLLGLLSVNFNTTGRESWDLTQNTHAYKISPSEHIKNKPVPPKRPQGFHSGRHAKCETRI